MSNHNSFGNIAETHSASMRRVRLIGVALLIVYAATRWIAVPADVIESDDVLFCFAVEKFDLSRHHPHPPGYPVYVALGKLVATLRVGSFTALMWIGLVASCSAVWPMYRLALERIGASRPLAWAACAVYGACPVVWLHSGAALSDVPGTAIALWVAWLLWRVVKRRNPATGRGTYVLAAAIAAIGIGVRPQLAVVFVPLLAWSGVSARVGLRTIVASAGVAAGLCAAWLVPMVWASGGWSEFISHFAAQSEWYMRYDTTMGEVNSAWRDRVNYWLHLWGAASTCWPMVALLVVGFIRLIRGDRRTAAFLMVWLVPYALFVFFAHSPATPRYALPAIAPLVMMATAALVPWPRAGAVIGAAVAAGLAAQAAEVVWRFHAEPIPPLQAASWIASRAGPDDAFVLDAGLEVLLARHEARLPWRIARIPSDEAPTDGRRTWLLTAHPRAERSAAYMLKWNGRRYRLFTRARFQTAYVYELNDVAAGN
jgi:4-amino-4-deoxy-L-arabinose transferase-like glycosyltransferase